MALVTFQAGAAMIHRRFTARDAAIMTTTTASGQHLAMIHHHAAPITGVMTGAADGAGERVINRPVIGMAVGAQADHLIVIHA